jgi:hypothetical protein
MDGEPMVPADVNYPPIMIAQCITLAVKNLTD